MKVAIFHNFMDNIGGAEIVSLSFARHFNATIYTTNIDFEKIKKMGFEDVIPRIQSIGNIPQKSPFKQQFAFWLFRRLNLGKQYDFYIISGDWAMSAVVNHHPNLWYVHSPLNELWQFKDFIKKEILSWWQNPIFEIWVYVNKKLSLVYAKYVDIWICNSKNTQNRIKKFYNKDAHIIYPPIDTEKYSYQDDQGYWLAVNRLFKNKRVELQLESFSKLSNKKLIIVGSYEKGAEQFEDYKKYIEEHKAGNIELRHWVTQEELIDLYSKCTGFITTAIDEDFGMTAVEALASGKPVIAPNEGGYKESVLHNQTGVLIDSIDSEKIIEAIFEIEKRISQNAQYYSDICIKKAQEFDREKCMSQLDSFVRN